TMIFCRRDLPTLHKNRFQRKQVSVYPVDQDHDGLLVWSQILDVLTGQGIGSVLVEGGARVAASALQAGIVDKLYLFVAPMILGGGMSFSDDLVPRRLADAFRLQVLRVQRVGPDILIQGYPLQSRRDTKLEALRLIPTEGEGMKGT
ncbi:MAG: dihydrofolate reductase family protein, partial [candidate division WOR-3 bacterium]